ncbi:putative HTH-type transcriptional regulator [BD1-7 clade bacterium]|uniref:Putative HTH-type transcriptional regulator n=1 Tax=BD1-7 clade bacterium TaxID=2029982 RepID=A0A5S9QJJ8_9GAMM|nr:putative HTH-type transcriptional regulator [BD1-7 clade bacterium]CAA0117867.1 putative HTH-type transcriptional regulator [BD1-7 clade bacterium]CAA0125394.1 putative HTH-type transcriptional regulator [BD1-7 clade bacterium]
MKPSETSSTYVPTRFAKSLLKLAEQRNFDISQILVNAGIEFNPLDIASPKHISAIHYSRIYQQILALLQDDSFGMPPGKGMSAGAFKMMCYAIIHCETLQKAVRRLNEFIEVFYDPELHLSMTVQGNTVTVSYPNYKLTNIVKGQAGEAYGLALWHRFFSWLIGMSIDVSDVRLVSERPPNADSYQRLFGAPVHFDATQNGFDFSIRYLEFPLAQTEASLKDFLRTAPYQMMVEPQEAESSELISNVRRVMGYDLSQGFPSFEVVAEALNMSPPTLRRHLRKEGVSYQKLKDQCRKDAAIAYLSRPELSVSAVAALMGFTDPSAFHRSFKKWTGFTPGQYRANEFAIEDGDDNNTGVASEA